MKYVCLALLLACVLVDTSMGYCYFEEFEGVDECIAEDGLVIEPSEPTGPSGRPLLVKLPGKCVKCSCIRVFPGRLVMNCCGFGVSAVKFPTGCSVETMEDGCSMKPGSFKCKPNA